MLLIYNDNNNHNKNSNNNNNNKKIYIIIIFIIFIIIIIIIIIVIIVVVFVIITVIFIFIIIIIIIIIFILSYSGVNYLSNEKACTHAAMPSVTDQHANEIDGHLPSGARKAANLKSDQQRLSFLTNQVNQRLSGSTSSTQSSKRKTSSKDDEVKVATFNEQEMLNSLIGHLGETKQPSSLGGLQNAHSLNKMSEDSAGLDSSNTSDDESDVFNKPLFPRDTFTNGKRRDTLESIASSMSSHVGIIMVTDFEDDDDDGYAKENAALVDSGYPSDVTNAPHNVSTPHGDATRNRTAAADDPQMTRAVIATTAEWEMEHSAQIFPRNSNGPDDAHSMSSYGNRSHSLSRTTSKGISPNKIMQLTI